mgnify:FL=1
MMTPEDLVARAMLSAVKRKVGIAFIDLDKLSYLPRAKYGIKPIFVSFGAENARTIIDNMAPDDWASFCEVNPWQSKMA